MAACPQDKGTVSARSSYSSEIDDKVTFGARLLTQHDRSDLNGDLSNAAKMDRKFPRAGKPDAVCSRSSGNPSDLTGSITHAIFASSKAGTQ